MVMGRRRMWWFHGYFDQRATRWGNEQSRRRVDTLGYISITMGMDNDILTNLDTASFPLPPYITNYQTSGRDI